MAIGRTCPRTQEFTLLFPKSHTLQNAAYLYFTAFVQMCRHIVLFLRKPLLSQVSDTFTRAFDTKFESYQSRLLTLAYSVKEEVSLASKHLHVSEADLQALERKQMWSFRGTVKQELLEAKRFRQVYSFNLLLDACSTFDHKVAWKQARKCGTSHWFLDSPGYKAWRHNGRRCSLLSCTGNLASGKTVMIASIIEDLTLAPKTYVVYVICTNEDPSSLKARTIFGSIARQILEPLRSQLDRHVFTDPPPLDSVDDVQDLLERYISSLDGQEIIVAIDGLEQCIEPEMLEVLSCIQRLRRSLPVDRSAVFKFYLSSRPETLKFLPVDMKSDFSLSMADGGADLVDYVDHTLEELCLNGKLRLGNPQIIIDIRDALEQGAQGMFLWVYLQMEEICSRKSDRSILEALQNLPRNLPETFDRILQKVSDYGRENASLCKSAFNLIIAALAPLTLEALQEALSVEPGNVEWDPSTLINDIQALIDCTAGLLILDEEARTVHFVHHSFRHYLLQETSPSSSPLSYYRADLVDASILLGQVCLTYLNFSIFRQQIVKAEKKTRDLNAISIVENSIQRPGITSKLARAYLKGRRKPDFDMFQTLRQITGKESSNETINTSLFAFSEYARKYWHRHCSRDPRWESKFEIGKSGVSMAVRYLHLEDAWDRLPDSMVKVYLRHPHLPFLAAASHNYELIKKITLVKFNDTMEPDQLSLYGVFPQDFDESIIKMTECDPRLLTSWNICMFVAAVGDLTSLRLLLVDKAPDDLGINAGTMSLLGFKIAASVNNKSAIEFIANELLPIADASYRYVDEYDRDILYYATVARDPSAEKVAAWGGALDLTGAPMDISLFDRFLSIRMSKVKTFTNILRGEYLSGIVNARMQSPKILKLDTKRSGKFIEQS